MSKEDQINNYIKWMKQHHEISDWQERHLRFVLLNSHYGIHPVITMSKDIGRTEAVTQMELYQKLLKNSTFQKNDLRGCSISVFILILVLSIKKGLKRVERLLGALNAICLF